MSENDVIDTAANETTAVWFMMGLCQAEQPH
jgi:hypothetical protein